MSQQTNFLYFSLMPQALIASMLPPVEFGKYMTGTRGRMAPSGQQAVFFEIDWDCAKAISYFDFNGLTDELVMINNEPKKSVHISQYRVLEHLPLESFKSLYLTTTNGQTLEIKKNTVLPEISGRNYFLFQLLSPRAIIVASTLKPKDFIGVITTNPINRIKFPKVMLIDLKINGLAYTPDSEAENLPYRGLENLKNCLKTLKDESKLTKTVDRDASGIHWRMINSGFYIGDGYEKLFYKFPEPGELLSLYYDWYRYAEKDLL